MNTSWYVKNMLNLRRYFSTENTEIKSMLASHYFANDDNGTDRISIMFNGRSLLYTFFNSLGLDDGDEVLLQAFTCSSVPNPIQWAGLKPVYVDINTDDLCMDPEDLKRKITKNSKVLIIQHTFGFIARTDELVKIARENGLVVVEDCAHALCVRNPEDNEYVGRSGDVSLLSFGFEKSLSSRVGAALIFNDLDLKAEFDKISNIPRPGFFLTLFWLLNPFLWVVVRKLYKYQDKIVRYLIRIGIPLNGFYQEEILGDKPRQYPMLLPDVLSDIVVNQLDSIGEATTRRTSTSRQLHKKLKQIPNIDLICRDMNGLPLILYPALTRDGYDASEFVEYARSYGIHLYEWYRPVVSPARPSLEAMGYMVGSCPVAEQLSKRVFSIPTAAYVDEGYVDKIISVMDGYFGQERR